MAIERDLSEKELWIGLAEVEQTSRNGVLGDVRGGFTNAIAMANGKVDFRTAVSQVADPTMTIRAQYDEQLEDNRLYVQLGMTRSGEKNPLFGPPGRSSTIVYENGGGQTRHYDDKGKPWVDVDWGHHPELGPSHVHWWDPDMDPRSEGARGGPEPAPPGWPMWDNGEAIPQPRGSAPMIPIYPAPFGPVPVPVRPMVPIRPIVPLRPILLM